MTTKKKFVLRTRTLEIQCQQCDDTSEVMLNGRLTIKQISDIMRNHLCVKCLRGCPIHFGGAK